MRAAPAFGVLGTLQADRDGFSLPLSSRRQRAVLAALLTRAGRPVPADELIEAAWGERLPGHPKAALQTVLSRLRAALGAELISASMSGYRLNVTADDVDASRFEALRERAAHAPDAAAAGLLGAALALWRGPAYAEFADRDFASAEAARLNGLRAATIEDYADLCLRSGRATDAIAHLQALQASEPWRDRCVELLMRALCGSGRATQALQVYDRHRRGLAAESGSTPRRACRTCRPGSSATSCPSHLGRCRSRRAGSLSQRRSSAGTPRWRPWPARYAAIGWSRSPASAGSARRGWSPSH